MTFAAYFSRTPAPNRELSANGINYLFSHPRCSSAMMDGVQFTLKRLLLAMTLIAVGLASATLPWRLSNSEYARLPYVLQLVTVVFFWSCGAIIGGGFGVLFRRPKAGALAGFAVSLLVAVLHAAASITIH